MNFVMAGRIMRSWAHNTSLRRVAVRLAHGTRRECVASCLGDLSETGWAGAGAANRVWYLHYAALPAVAGETPTVVPSPKEEMDLGAPGDPISQLHRQRGTRRRRMRVLRRSF